MTLDVIVTQSAHTWHTQNDRKEGSSALTCPHCRAVFPGKPIVLLHLAQEHPLSGSMSFVSTVGTGGHSLHENRAYLQTAPKLTHHFYNFPVSNACCRMASSSRVRDRDRKSRDVQKMETKLAEFHEKLDAAAKLAVQTSLIFRITGRLSSAFSF